MFNSQQFVFPFDGQILERTSLLHQYGQDLYHFKGEDGKEYMIKQVLKQISHREWDINMALSKLENNINQNIIRVYSVKETKEYYFIQMEYCRTRSIEQMNFTNDQIVQLLIDIIRGLKLLKEMNIIHRDIKPHNIVYQDYSFKLIDFGTAKRLQNVNQSAFNTQQTGTLIFMAPQVHLGMPYSSKCDIWSLGSTIYYILYRKSVWEQLQINKSNAQRKWNQYLQGKRQLQKDLFQNMKKNQFTDIMIKMMQLQEVDRFSLEELTQHVNQTFLQLDETWLSDQIMYQNSVLRAMSQMTASFVDENCRNVIDQFVKALIKIQDNITFVAVIRVLRDYLQKTYHDLNELEDREYYQILIVIIDQLIYSYSVNNSKINIWDKEQHKNYCSNNQELKCLLRYV